MSQMTGSRIGRGTRTGLLLGALALGACAPQATGYYQPPTADPVPKRLQAAYVPFSYVAYFATDRAELDQAERQRLERFLDTLPPPEGVSVRIRGHADERLGEVYNADLAARRARHVAALFAGRGYSDIEIGTVALGEAVPVPAGSKEEAWQRSRRVEIVVQVPMITLPACPDWSAPGGVAAGNEPMSQLGCATALNLAATIANPADLVAGRPAAPADGVREAAAVERYRADKVKKLLGSKQKGKAGQ